MAEVPDTADVVIIGGGVHGASLAYHLTHKRAGRVVLLERRFIASGPSGRRHGHHAGVLGRLTLVSGGRTLALA